MRSCIAFVVIPILLLEKLLIARYDEFKVHLVNEVKPSVTKFATRSHPPEIKQNGM